MHFEILAEDLSGKIIVEAVVEKILSSISGEHSYRVIPYRGLGHIPENLGGTADPRRRLLLEKLPRLLRGYGKSLRDFPAAVIVVVDADDRDCVAFKREMLDVLESCNPKPDTLFRLAVEEIEAWLLGDQRAVRSAYPNARESALSNYVQDSICDTWEKLADAIYPGGSRRLKPLGYPEVGRVKCEWAMKIAKNLEPDANLSVSFQVFLMGVRNLANLEGN